MKELIAYIILAVVLIALGILMANWIGNSDLPYWVKVWLLT